MNATDEIMNISWHFIAIDHHCIVSWWNSSPLFRPLKRLPIQMQPPWIQSNPWLQSLALIVAEFILIPLKLRTELSYWTCNVIEPVDCGWFGPILNCRIELIDQFNGLNQLNFTINLHWIGRCIWSSQLQCCKISIQFQNSNNSNSESNWPIEFHRSITIGWIQRLICTESANSFDQINSDASKSPVECIEMANHLVKLTPTIYNLNSIVLLNLID